MLTGSKAYQNMNGNVLFEEMCVNRILLFFQNDTDFLEIGNDSVGHGGNLFSREGTGVVGEGQSYRDGRVFTRVIDVDNVNVTDQVAGLFRDVDRRGDGREA